MHNQVNNLISIQKEIQQINPNTKVIAVTKTFKMDVIKPLIDHGHNHYGENKVQEAQEKWADHKNENVKLHLIGKLQTNKVKFCLPLFDYIHSLDSIKLADKIANEQIKKNFKPKIFIQINVGDEDQKSGFVINDFQSSYSKLKNDFDLNIIGLMCIPPNNLPSEPFFKKMKEMSTNIGFKELSMGMSNDYVSAVKNSSTYIRVGSKIFGERS